MIVVSACGLLLAAAGLAGAAPAAELGEVVAANNGFAVDLMGQIAAENPAANAFISPFSVATVLQMTAAGAGGETRKEMQQALKTDGLAPDSLYAGFKELNRQLASRTEVTLDLANGLWFQRGLHLMPAFTKVNRKFFQAGLAEVDFADPQSAATINGWAEHQTRGKIGEVVTYPFPPHTRLILANAIYFKGKWAEAFKPELTRPRAFHRLNGALKQTPMMARDGNFAYQESPDFQAVKLDYRGGLQMELYLPATHSNPRDLLPLLSARQSIEHGFARRQGTVILPKFKMEDGVLLNRPLQALGMKRAFSAGADFSGSADERLFISEVLQKSYVEVNEEGTEAAAVTTVRMEAMIVRGPEPDRFTLILDRPFLFMISDAETGLILFLGIVNDPGGN